MQMSQEEREETARRKQEYSDKWRNKYIERDKIVDMNEYVKPTKEQRIWRTFIEDTVSATLRSRLYVSLTVLVVFANIVVVSWDQPTADNRLLLTVLDLLFLMFFTFDLFMEWTYNFCEFWFHIWKCVDAVIVILTVLWYTSIETTSFSSLAGVRIIRILRVWRVVSLILRWEKRLEALVQGLVAMLKFIIVLFDIMLIFVVMGLSMFGPRIPSLFGTMEQSLWTVFQLGTLESWGTFIDAVVEAGMYAEGAVFLFAYSLLMVVVGYHLIAAVITECFEDGRLERSKQLNAKRLQQRHVRHLPANAENDKSLKGFWCNNPVYRNLYLVATEKTYMNMERVLNAMDKHLSSS